LRWKRFSREGARRMLQAALENEVAEYLAEHAHPRGWYIKRGQVIPPTESAKTADP